MSATTANTTAAAMIHRRIVLAPPDPPFDAMILPPLRDECVNLH